MSTSVDILLPYQRDYIALCDANRTTIVKKGRQSGFSLVMALWAVRQRLLKNTNCYYVSRTERTAKQFCRYARLWAESLNIPITYTQTLINFPNGNFLQVMPSGPDVVRGLPGDVIWDEAGFTEHAQEFYDATFPTIQAGHSFHIIGTVGSPTSFYEEEWERAVQGKSIFKPFKITMDDAIAQGLANKQPGDHLKLPEGPERNQAFLDFIKKGMSKEAYDAEYNCIQRGLGGLITLEEYTKQAVVEEVYDNMGAFTQARMKAKKPIRELYACVDPAFTHDLAAIWVLEKCYDNDPNVPEEYRDIYITVCVNSWHKIAPRALFQVLKPYIDHPNMCKCIIDQGGPGFQLAQDLTQDFRGIVEPLVVTNSVKQEAFERVKYFLQTDRLGLPKNRPDLQDEFLAMARKVSPSGTVTYDGRIGPSHGDRFTACAYALQAGEANSSRVALSIKDE